MNAVYQRPTMSSFRTIFEVINVCLFISAQLCSILTLGPNRAKDKISKSDQILKISPSVYDFVRFSVLRLFRKNSSKYFGATGCST